MCSCVFFFNRLTGGEETASPSPWSPCLVRQDRQPQGPGLNVHYAVGRNNMERTTVFVCHNLAIPPTNPLDLTRLSSAYPGPSQQHTTCFAVELHLTHPTCQCPHLDERFRLPTLPPRLSDHLPIKPPPYPLVAAPCLVLSVGTGPWRRSRPLLIEQVLSTHRSP